MSDPHRPSLVLLGAHSSPYSRKMRAVLRYRRIPQAKCLEWIRAEHDELSGTDQARVAAVLAGTGCEVLVP